MDGSKSAGQIVVRVHSAIEDIGLESWNACAFLSKEEKKRGRPDNPFTDYRFLHALEASGSARAETGWYPQHLAVEDENGTVLAVMPAYAKSHSQGEYIFDHAWADAFERAGGRYYPKLLSAVPFTPVTGPRLLVGPDKKGRTDKANALITGIAGVVERLDISSAHINFASEADATHLTDSGFLLRTDCQFHWKNNSFSTFDAFMETLASRKRKQLRKERRQALENGISIDWITGSDLTESVWDRFFDFYIDTGARKWGRPYLTREFFSLVSETMADQILLVMAKRDGHPIAGALNFVGETAIYGRHWGCVEDHPFLHFEVCYYQAIDYAIAHGLKVVEAGAQGGHKLARGYEPVTTRSAHFIANPSFRSAVANYLEDERRHVASEAEYLSERTPFKKTLTIT